MAQTISTEDEAENHQTESDREIVDGSDEGTLDLGDRRQTAVVIEKNDRSLSEFHRWYREGRLRLDPEWQQA
jgi:hypothetical protein